MQRESRFSSRVGRSGEALATSLNPHVWHRSCPQITQTGGKVSNLPNSLGEIWLSAPEKGRRARSSEVPTEELRPQDPFEASSWTEWLAFPRI